MWPSLVQAAAVRCSLWHWPSRVSEPSFLIRRRVHLRDCGENFCSRTGNLYSIVSADLPAPYNRAIVTLPNVAHHAIVDAVQKQPCASLRYRPSFAGLIREGERVVGLTMQGPDGPRTIRAKLVV